MESGSPRWLDFLNGLSALAVATFTYFLWRLQGRQVAIHKQQTEHFRRTERAYVGMSPMQPGLVFLGANEDAEVPWTTQIRFTNTGNTPARVLRYSISLWLRDEPLPGLPPSADGLRTTRIDTLLLKEDSFFARPDEGATITVEQFTKVEVGKLLAHVYGFVEYEDQFGGCYRRWFLRTYSPGIEHHMIIKRLDNRFSGWARDPERQNLVLPNVMNYNHEETLT